MVPLRVCHRLVHLRGLPSSLRPPLPSTMAAPQPGCKTLRPTTTSSPSPAGPATKRSRTMATDAAASPASAGCSAMKAEFTGHAEYLNALNDKRERLVKASRDVTMNSKKVIFQVHRISKNNREEVLSKAENDLAAVVNQYIGKLVKELQGTDFWKLRRAYTPGVQEYIEAATFCRFCKTGTLLGLAEINDSLLALSDESIEPLQINVLDYLLGVADLSGELMRLAIGRISDGEVEHAKNICAFVRDIYRELTLLVLLMDDNNEMKKKMEVMLQSVVKIENACFSVHVRGSEYIPMLGTSGESDYPFFGAADYDQ
ncbi:translin-associated protein X-like [Triticum dicoccoides]|uniref:translin-associated protein X-like n=1 Tax=Triticum dicoccoides TaxID=85692 RepID=UPI00188F7A93|nr:translin-associated protein X-like [Triticum dicoccoides]